MSSSPLARQRLDATAKRYSSAQDEEDLDGSIEDGQDDAIVARPDGYYWLSQDGRIEVGPFETVAAAWADMHASDEDAPEPGESLEEAEAEIGMGDWGDGDAGDLSDSWGSVDDH